MSFPSHALVAKRAAALAIMTASVIGITGFAAQDIAPAPAIPVVRVIDGIYANKIMSTFSKIGAKVPGVYSNESVEASGFDFQSYVSHTCFHPTERDAQSCTALFGPYADLQRTMQSGDLFIMLVRAHILTANDEEIVASMYNKTMATLRAKKVAATMVEAATVQEAQRQDRSSSVWDICKSQFEDAGSRQACFQRNRRLVNRFDTAINGNVQ